MQRKLASAIGLFMLGTGISLAQTAISTRVNFQSPTTPVPFGYLSDNGQPFDSTRGYGWVEADNPNTPFNITLNARDRGLPWLDPRLNSLIYLRGPAFIGDGTTVDLPATWECDLPNGTYSVQVSVGDQPLDTGFHSLDVEGVRVVNGFRPRPRWAYAESLVSVEVQDGRLTFTAPVGSTTRINYVDIASRPGFTSLTWTTTTPSPLGRSEAQGGMVESKLYVVGGYTDTTFIPAQRTDVYNPATKKWSRLADLPVATTHAGTAIVGQSLYLAGGYISNQGGGQTFATTNVWRYDVTTNSWFSLPPLPVARGSGALAVLGRELHFFGGGDINRKDKGDHWFLNLDGGTTWQVGPALPNPRTHLGAVVLGGKIYAVGGQRGADQNMVTQTSVHSWSPAQPNLWTTITPMPGPRSHAATFIMGNRIILLGGQLNYSTPLASGLAYDPISATWSSLTPLPLNRFSGIAGVYNGQILYTTGSLASTTYLGTPL